MFIVDLKSQVPMYGPEYPDWGGPACCQMAMHGYPPGATSCYVDQTTIWNYIQSNNKEGGTGPWGIGWYSDPYAVTKTLNDLCPPQHSWIDKSGLNKDEVLYTLFRWMANYQYASLVCVFSHDYWSVLVYFKTSDDPRTTTNPTLERIGWYEPYYSAWSGGPQCDYKEVDGNVWMNGPTYWGFPCGGFTNPNCGQFWKNKWVGIGEPPAAGGRIQITSFPRVGERIIDPKEAVNIARGIVKQRCQEATDFLLRRLSNTRATSPMLVREQVPLGIRKSVDRDVHYYIVPFINGAEVDRAGENAARFSVLINAYSGHFEELCVFQRPVRYRPESEAIRLVGRTLRLNRTQLTKIEAELVAQPIRPYVSTALPAWKVKLADRTVFVTQAGTILGTLNYSTYKGA